jgi:anti-anti-sigma factor
MQTADWPEQKTVTQDGEGDRSVGRRLRRLELGRVMVTSESALGITVLQTNHEVVVQLTGRIDVDSSPDLRDRLRTLLSAEALPQTIVVDLTGVPYIETSGIATLIEALRIARHHQTNLRLQGLSGAALRLFEVTGVLALFEASNSGQGSSGQKVS